MALARLRSGNVQQFYAATTPEGFGWAFDTFEKNAGDDTALIRAKTTDNPYLPEGFIDSLLQNYPEQLIQSYLNGVFVNLNTGQVYDRFDRAKHVIKAAPVNWTMSHATGAVISTSEIATQCAGTPGQFISSNRRSESP